MYGLRELSSDLEALVGRTVPAVASLQRRGGQGTGVVLAPDGYLLTNAHVVGEAAQVAVGLADGSDRSGRVVGRDDRTDVAVVHVEGAHLPTLPLAEGRGVRVGQIVVAVGNPLRFERSVSLGVVSALDRTLPAPGGRWLEGLIQTDAAINPGNSGGPLMDAEGTVVGLNTAAVPFAQGIGFAVPAWTASWVAAVLIQRGEIRRPYLGISARGVDLPAPLAAQVGQPRAVHVLQVASEAPAARDGIAPGDLLLKANGAPLTSIDDLQRVMVLGSSLDLDLDLFRGAERISRAVHPSPPDRAA